MQSNPSFIKKEPDSSLGIINDKNKEFVAQYDEFLSYVINVSNKLFDFAGELSALHLDDAVEKSKTNDELEHEMEVFELFGFDPSLWPQFDKLFSRHTPIAHFRAGLFSFWASNTSIFSKYQKEIKNFAAEYEKCVDAISDSEVQYNKIYKNLSKIAQEIENIHQKIINRPIRDQSLFLETKIRFIKAQEEVLSNLDRFNGVNDNFDYEAEMILSMFEKSSIELYSSFFKSSANLADSFTKFAQNQRAFSESLKKGSKNVTQIIKNIMQIGSSSNFERAIAPKFELSFDLDSFLTS